MPSLTKPETKELISNGDFELKGVVYSPNTYYLNADWTAFKDAACKIIVLDEPEYYQGFYAYSGSNALLIVSGASGEGAGADYVSQTCNIVPNSTNVLTFYSLYRYGKARYSIINMQNLSSLICAVTAADGDAADTWSKTTYSFTAPPLCNQIKLCLWSSAGDEESVYFDKVSLLSTYNVMNYWSLRKRRGHKRRRWQTLN